MTGTDSNERTDKIARLNDAFRTSLTGGRVMVTRGVTALGSQTQDAILQAVKGFSAFTPDNDPHGERDFGAFEMEGVGRVFWKIDYYNRTLDGGSEDPADRTKTQRVLTIMLASEYHCGRRSAARARPTRSRPARPSRCARARRSHP